MKRECSCEDWKESMPQIIGAQMFEWTHGGKYTGTPFRFCPWCGKELKEV